MKYILSVLLILGFSVPGQALFLLDLYGGMSMGSVSLNETYLANSFAHSSTFFIGHWGFNVGVRPKLQLGPVGIGVVGELGWVGDTLERKQLSTNGSGNNRIESYRGIVGGTLSFAFTPTWGISGEYYPSVENSVTYSDNNQFNPFRKGDQLRASGYGIGTNFSFFGTIPFYVMYRRLSYKDVQTAGVGLSLPTARYTSELLVEDVLAGALVTF